MNPHTTTAASSRCGPHAFTGTLIVALAIGTLTPAEAATRFVGPTSSQPLSLTADDAFLAVVNPDNDSVSVFDLRFDRNRKLRGDQGAEGAERRRVHRDA